MKHGKMRGILIYIYHFNNELLMQAFCNTLIYSRWLIYLS